MWFFPSGATSALRFTPMTLSQRPCHKTSLSLSMFLQRSRSDTPGCLEDNLHWASSSKTITPKLVHPDLTKMPGTTIIMYTKRKSHWPMGEGNQRTTNMSSNSDSATLLIRPWRQDTHTQILQHEALTSSNKRLPARRDGEYAVRD